MDTISNIPTNFTQNLAVCWLDCFRFLFPAHACHKTALVATILTADASLLCNVTVPITLTSKGGLAIFCASDIKALAGQTDESPKVVATGPFSANYADLQILVLLRGTVVGSF